MYGLYAPLVPAHTIPSSFVTAYRFNGTTAHERTDLDSYYTMDITLLALPQTQDRLAQMMFAGHAILSGTPTEDDKRKFAIHAAMLQEANHDRIGADVQTVINEDQNFGGVSRSLQERLPASFAGYSAATKAFIALNTEAAAGTRAVTPAEYVDAGTRAREASFAMWDVAVDELATIAQFMERIGHIRELMDEIDGASRDQATGVRQAAAGVHQVERGVQSASATAEEAAAASEELAAQAAVARTFVDDLRVAIRGSRSFHRHDAFDDGASNHPASRSQFDKRKMAPGAATARVA